MTVHKRNDKATPKWMRKLKGPVIETGKHWVVPSVPISDDGTAVAVAGAGSSRAEVASDAPANPASVEEAVRLAAEGASAFIRDHFEMEARGRVTPFPLLFPQCSPPPPLRTSPLPLSAHPPPRAARIQPAEVRRVLAYAVDFGLSSLSPGRLGAHAVVNREVLDYFDTASAIEQEVRDAEELEEVLAAGGRRKCDCCEECGGGQQAQQQGGGAGAQGGSSAAAPAAGAGGGEGGEGEGKKEEL